MFNGKKVYKVKSKCGSQVKTTIYSYSNENVTDENHHFNINGLCVNCKKRQRTVSVDISDWYYGEKPKEPVAASEVKADDDEIEYYYGKEGMSASKTVPTEAGKYYVVAMYKETNKYVSVSAKKNFEITRKDFGDIKAEKTDVNKGENGWYKGDVTLKAPQGYYISRTDDIDGFGTATKLVVSESGDVCNYYLRDIETNAISANIGDEVKIDRNAPVADENSISYSQGTDNPLLNIWNTFIGRDVVTVTTTVSDAESGISTDGISVTLINSLGKEQKADGIKVVSDADGKYKVSFTIPGDFEGKYKLNVKDIAGNSISNSSKQDIIADTKAPEIKLSVNKMEYTAKAVCNDKAEAVVSVDDNYASSGIKSVKYSIDGQDAVTLQPDGKKFDAEKISKYTSADITIQSEGMHIMTVTAVDNAGNEQNSKYEIEIKNSNNPQPTPDVTPINEPTVKPTAEPAVKPTADTDMKSINKAAVSEKLSLRIISGRTANKLKWEKVSGAAGYEIYASVCSKNKYSMSKIAEPNKTKTSYTHKKLKKATCYVYQIAAYKMSKGAKKYIARYNEQKAYTAGDGKYTNPSKLKIEKSKLAVYAGKTGNIMASAAAPKGKKMRTGISELTFISSNKKVASVTQNGKVKGKKKGKCVIYCITQNGIKKKISITVKKAVKKSKR